MIDPVSVVSQWKENERSRLKGTDPVAQSALTQILDQVVCDKQDPSLVWSPLELSRRQQPLIPERSRPLAFSPSSSKVRFLLDAVLCSISKTPAEKHLSGRKEAQTGHLFCYRAGLSNLAILAVQFAVLPVLLPALRPAPAHVPVPRPVPLVPPLALRLAPMAVL